MKKPILFTLFLLIIGATFTSCFKNINLLDTTDKPPQLAAFLQSPPYKIYKSDIVTDQKYLIYSDSSFFAGPIRYSIWNSKINISQDSISLITSGDVFNIFYRPVEFGWCFFNSSHWSHRNGHFDQVWFDSSLTFENCKFLEPLSFANDTFMGKVRFYEEFDSLKKNLSFSNCYFDKGLHISHTTLEEGLAFDNSTIKEILDLSNTKFLNDSRPIFRNCTLPDTINLSHSFLSDEIDLTETNTSGKICKINLLKTNIDKIKMLYRNFELYFPNKMKDSLQYSDEISSVYEQLLANFEKNGFRDSYEKLDIEYKNWQSDIKGVLDRIALKTSNIWWLHGYEKWRILYWTFGFIAIFSIFNCVYFKRLNRQYEVEKLNEKHVQSSAKNWTTPRKLIIAFLYTGFIFFKFAIDFRNIKFQSLWWVSILIAQYIIGLVCTGFLINWILKG